MHQPTPKKDPTQIWGFMSIILELGLVLYVRVFIPSVIEIII